MGVPTYDQFIEPILRFWLSGQTARLLRKLTTPQLLLSPSLMPIGLSGCRAEFSWCSRTAQGGRTTA